MTTTVEKRKIPLKLRFKAWWEGYNLDDMLRQMDWQEDDQEEISDHPDAAPPDAKKAAPAKKNTPKPLTWNKNRIKINQLIWGMGYCGPGGPEHIESLSKLLSLTPEMSALVIGAELGGPCRVLAEKYGVWITGYEVSTDLVEKANILSKEADLDKKAVITHLDLNDAEPFDRRFDRAFSKERLYSFQDKKSLLQKTFDALKEESLFLMTDYTLSNVEALEDEDVQTWFKMEPTPPYPVTADIISEMLKDVGFSVRVNENISETYIKLITESWIKAEKIVEDLSKDGTEGIESISTLMQDAEFWSLRKKLLKNGLINVSRFLVYKPKKPIR